jgi:hypothetical protein
MMDIEAREPLVAEVEPFREFSETHWNNLARAAYDKI